VNRYKRIRIIHIGNEDLYDANCYVVEWRWVWWPLWSRIQTCDSLEYAQQIYKDARFPQSKTKTYVVCEDIMEQPESTNTLLRPAE